MSYPPPPGLKIAAPSSVKSSPTTAIHASLPPRPPQPNARPSSPYRPSPNSTSPAIPTAPGTREPSQDYGGTNKRLPGNSSTFAFQPRSVATQSLRPPNLPTTATPALPNGFGGPQGPYAHGSSPFSGQYQQLTSQANTSSRAYQEHYVGPSPPQIRNPFPLPGQGGLHQSSGRVQDQMHPEMEAQILQWQSAYASKDSTSSNLGRTFGSRFVEGNASSTGANSAPLGARPDSHGTPLSSSAITSAANADTDVAAVVTGADGKQKTVIRSGGGQVWQDPSLLEWDPAHFRLFIGNLAGEVTDESLLKAFAKYPSVHKARVVRDKRTTKSKGYGFVSFVDGEEYFQAARDMQGKYIGSHPVLLRKSTTEIRPTVPKDQKKNGRWAKGNSNGMRGGGHVGNGIQKKQAKVKGGLRVLG